eukprot:GHVQ01015852.1.p1 GENE.GHVQ01015852.1~~GHVQ01015852.1.p1  ORF type:complete len:1232 (+),score=277.57 GHVQ01015852.1:159-3854(+)
MTDSSPRIQHEGVTHGSLSVAAPPANPIAPFLLPQQNPAPSNTHGICSHTTNPPCTISSCAPTEIYPPPSCTAPFSTSNDANPSYPACFPLQCGSFVESSSAAAHMPSSANGNNALCSTNPSDMPSSSTLPCTVGGFVSSSASSGNLPFLDNTAMLVDGSCLPTDQDNAEGGEMCVQQQLHSQQQEGTVPFSSAHNTSKITIGFTHIKLTVEGGGHSTGKTREHLATADMSSRYTPSTNPMLFHNCTLHAQHSNIQLTSSLTAPHSSPPLSLPLGGREPSLHHSFPLLHHQGSLALSDIHHNPHLNSVQFRHSMHSSPDTQSPSLSSLLFRAPQTTRTLPSSLQLGDAIKEETVSTSSVDVSIVHQSSKLPNYGLSSPPSFLSPQFPCHSLPHKSAPDSYPATTDVVPNLTLPPPAMLTTHSVHSSNTPLPTPFPETTSLPNPPYPETLPCPHTSSSSSLCLSCSHERLWDVLPINTNSPGFSPSHPSSMLSPPPGFICPPAEPRRECPSSCFPLDMSQSSGMSEGIPPPIYDGKMKQGHADSIQLGYDDPVPPTVCVTPTAKGGGRDGRTCTPIGVRSSSSYSSSGAAQPNTPFLKLPLPAIRRLTVGCPPFLPPSSLSLMPSQHTPEHIRIMTESLSLPRSSPDFVLSERQLNPPLFPPPHIVPTLPINCHTIPPIPLPEFCDLVFPSQNSPGDVDGKSLGRLQTLLDPPYISPIHLRQPADACFFDEDFDGLSAVNPLWTGEGVSDSEECIKDHYQLLAEDRRSEQELMFKVYFHNLHERYTTVVPRPLRRCMKMLRKRRKQMKVAKAKHLEYIRNTSLHTSKTTVVHQTPKTAVCPFDHLVIPPLLAHAFPDTSPPGALRLSYCRPMFSGSMTYFTPQLPCFIDEPGKQIYSPPTFFHDELFPLPPRYYIPCHSLRWVPYSPAAVKQLFGSYPFHSLLIPNQTNADGEEEEDSSNTPGGEGCKNGGGGDDEGEGHGGGGSHDRSKDGDGGNNRGDSKDTGIDQASRGLWECSNGDTKSGGGVDGNKREMEEENHKESNQDTDVHRDGHEEENRSSSDSIGGGVYRLKATACDATARGVPNVHRCMPLEGTKDEWKWRAEQRIRSRCHVLDKRQLYTRTTAPSCAMTSSRSTVGSVGESEGFKYYGGVQDRNKERRFGFHKVNMNTTSRKMRYSTTGRRVIGEDGCVEKSAKGSCRGGAWIRSSRGVTRNGRHRGLGFEANNCLWREA